MGLLSLEGVYEDGRVHLDEPPVGLHRARVIVTFLPEHTAPDAEAERLRREAGERMLARMRAGIDFGGERFNREELYEERIANMGGHSG